MPTLALSNIAWPRDQHAAAFALLSDLGITEIEIAPLNLLPSWDCDLALVHDLRSNLDALGLSCVALQGIFNGIAPANLLVSPQPLFAHLRRVARIAGILGAKACVFGAPKFRNALGQAYPRAFNRAVQFLREIGPAFAAENSALTFEPVSTRYGCNFITTTQQAIALVETVATLGIGLQIDTGTIFCEQEDPAILARAIALSVPLHVHISEPDLAPIGSQLCEHRALARYLRNYPGTLSIEMRATPTWEADIRRSVSFVRRMYFP